MPGANIVGFKRKRSYKGSTYKRTSKSLILRSIGAIQRQIVSTCVGTAHNFLLGSNGFLPNLEGGVDVSGPGLSMAFSLTGAYYSVGSALGGPKKDSVIMGAPYSNILQFKKTYDQYRIRKVDIEIYYSINSVSNQQPGLPLLYTVIDYDDQGFLNGVSDALAYSSCRIMQLGNSAGGSKQKMVLSKPTVRVGAGTVAATNVGETNVLSMLKVSPWLSTAASTIEHAGAKMFVQIDPALTGSVNVVVRTYIDFKYSK